MNAHDLEQGRDYYLNTNHTNLPGWAWKHDRVQIKTLPPRSDGYVEVWPVGAENPAERRQLHVTHLRTTPVPAGRAPSRVMPGKNRHIKPEAGEELTLDSLLEGM